MEFLDLSEEDQIKVLNNWSNSKPDATQASAAYEALRQEAINMFETSVADNKFFHLPYDEQDRIRDQFVESQIGQNPNPPAPPPVSTSKPKFSIGRLGRQVVTNAAQGIGDIITAQAVGERQRKAGYEEDERVLRQDVGLTTQLPSEQAAIGQALKEAAIAKGAPRDRAFPVEKYLTPDEVAQISLETRKSLSGQYIQSAEQMAEALPKPLEGVPSGAGGVIEQAVGGMAWFAPSMTITALNLPAGTATTSTQIFGGKYKELTDSGKIDHQTDKAGHPVRQQ